MPTLAVENGDAIVVMLGIAAMVLALLAFASERAPRRRTVYGSCALLMLTLALVLGFRWMFFREDTCRLLGGMYQGNPPRGRCAGELGSDPVD